MKIELNENIYRGIAKVSPNLNIKLRYFMIYKRFFPRKPETFVEKILWLRMKYYNKSPLVAQCADKVKVRDYVIEKGCGEVLNELIGIYDNVLDAFIAIEKYEQFAMKWNFGCGYNVICSDKSKMDLDEAKIKMAEWGVSDKYLAYAEMQYEKCKRKIIVERYLATNEQLPIDYKCYCFNGKVLAILVMSDRDSNIKAGFYSTVWTYMEFSSIKYREWKDAPCPSSLEKMLYIAEKLSEGIPFVRIDFYDINGKLIFGEMTFSPAGGYFASEVLIEGKTMGEYIDISKQYSMLL